MGHGSGQFAESALDTLFGRTVSIRRESSKFPFSPRARATLLCSYALFEHLGIQAPLLRNLSDGSKTLLISAGVVYDILRRDG